MSSTPGSKGNMLQGWMKLVIGLCGIFLIAAMFLPVWMIQLAAPQYPEGLVLKIFAHKLGGNVDIVNGLNHYIGMKTLHAEDFPEFTILPYLLGFFALFCFIVAFTGRAKLLYVLFGLYVLFAAVAMADFWRWEYNYGHNLSSDAAIQVPGMTYQPPLIGYKQLLNFGAYSIPDIGGWLMAAAGVIMLLCIGLIWRGRKRLAPVIAAALTVFTFSACNAGPQAIQVGVDNCHFCKMGIADARFGGEVLSNKGRVWKFDDMHCMLGFLKGDELKKDALKEVYFVRFDAGHELLPSEGAYLLQAESLRSPMAGNVAAFADEHSRKEAATHYKGKTVLWNELYR